jgi:tetratricopeptide (TPR) repeat protein
VDEGTVLVDMGDPISQGGGIVSAHEVSRAMRLRRFFLPPRSGDSEALHGGHVPTGGGGDSQHAVGRAVDHHGRRPGLMERYSEALVHHEKALTIAAEIAEPYERTRALCGIGNIDQETGSYRAALDRYGQALVNARKISDSYREAVIHDGIAKTVLQRQGPQAARIHWRQALDLFQTLDVPEAQAVAIRLQTISERAS